MTAHPPVKQYLLRPRVTLRGFQWDGEEVEGFQRIATGLDELGNQTYNLVAVLRGPLDIEEESFAVEGDWIITGACGSWVWHQHEFDATYEILEEEA